MNKKNKKNISVQEALQNMQVAFALDEKQVFCYEKYLQLLSEWNNKFNLTAICDPVDIIQYHFYDSLIVLKILDKKNLTGICDVGSGGGFPGIPLKIFFSDIPVLLIEVCKKKILFLREVIAQLELSNIEIYEQDWRTFVRTTNFNINLFVARASLQPSELLRVFKPSTAYTNAKLVYWASKSWESTEEQKKYITQTYPYTIDDKERMLYVFRRKEEA